MTRSEKFFYNTIASAIYQIAIVIVGIILPRMLLTSYGSEINGIVSSVTQFVNYFILVEAGLSSATVFALYKPLAQNDHKQINGIVTAAKNFYNSSGWVFVLLTVALAVGYPLFTSTTELSVPALALLILALGVNGAVQFFTLGKYRAIITADQRQYVISIASILYYLVNTAIIATLAYFRVNIVITYSLAIVAVFIRSIILALYCRKKYPFLNFKETPNKKALDRRWSAFYLQLLGTAQKGLPIIIITVMTDFITVSIYSIFNMVISGIYSILDIFQSGLSASFGDLLARKEMKRFQSAYEDFEYTYYALIAFVYGVAAVMIMPFIVLYTAGVTDANYNQPLVGILFILNGFLYNLKTPQGMLVLSAGLYKETKVQTTIQAAIILVLGLCLTPYWGLHGVLIALALSNLYRVIDLAVYIPKNVTLAPVRNTFKRMAFCLLTFIAIQLPFFFIQFTISGYFRWAGYAVLVSCYAIVVTLLVNYMAQPILFKRVSARVFSFVKSKLHK